MVNNDELQRQMERYLAHFNRAGKRATILFTASAHPTPAWSPALDMYETQASFVVLLDLAGVDADNTEVQTQPHVLTVRGVRRERHGRYAPTSSATTTPWRSLTDASSARCACRQA